MEHHFLILQPYKIRSAPANVVAFSDEAIQFHQKSSSSQFHLQAKHKWPVTFSRRQYQCSGVIISYNSPLREFTNIKTSIRVTVKINENKLALLINDALVTESKDFKMEYGGDCISCGVPDGARFIAVYWTNTTTDADNIKVYISKVKITKVKITKD